MNNGCNIFTKEPIIHSHITDVLPEEHPMANQEVYCKSCGVMLHSSTNECMQTWYETEFGNYCTKCFSPIAVMELLEGCFLNHNNTPVERSTATSDTKPIGKSCENCRIKNVDQGAMNINCSCLFCTRSKGAYSSTSEYKDNWQPKTKGE